MSIEAQRITFRYPKGPIVLDELSCAVKTGAMTAIVGPNGSGKSTLIRLLAGLRNPESGVITLAGQDLSSMRHDDRAYQVAFIEQRPNLAFDFETRKVVEFGGHARRPDCQRVNQALERFELTQIAHTPYGHLSVGQQQRVSMARAWVQISANSSGYLLADEPCSAMDPRYAQQTMRALRALADSGIGVGVVIHDLTSAARWADKAIVLDGCGKIAGHGKASKVLSPELLSQVFELPISRHKLSSGQTILVSDDDFDGSHASSG